MKIKKNDTGSTDAPSTSLLLSFYFSVFLVLYIFFFFLRIVLLLPGWFTCTSSPLFHPHFSSRIYIHTYTPRTQLHSAMKVYIPSYTRSCAMAASIPLLCLFSYTTRTFTIILCLTFAVSLQNLSVHLIVAAFPAGQEQEENSEREKTTRTLTASRLTKRTRTRERREGVAHARELDTLGRGRNRRPGQCKPGSLPVDIGNVRFFACFVYSSLIYYTHARTRIIFNVLNNYL